MSNETSLPRQKTMTIGQRTFPITKPVPVQPAIADVIVEARHYGGVIALSVGTLITDGNADGELAEIRIAGRLRMTLEMAANLSAILSGMISDNNKSKETAN